MTRTFDDLVAEGAATPVDGWDFSWFAGRATEARPPWGYAALVAERLPRAGAVLDVQTGGGEVLATALAAAAAHPPVLAATESWPPNVALARDRLAPFGGTVAAVGDEDRLPFPAASFDLVVSRHPTTVVWPEIARVLRPGGTYLSQQVGAGTMRELTDAMMGPQPVSDARDPERARTAAGAAGLNVVRLETASLPATFADIAAVIVFLRKVIWTVPDFSVDAYREPLRRLHDQISSDGPFRATTERFLIEATSR